MGEDTEWSGSPVLSSRELIHFRFLKGSAAIWKLLRFIVISIIRDLLVMLLYYRLLPWWGPTRVSPPSPQNFRDEAYFNLLGNAELKSDHMIPFAWASGCFRANVQPNSDKVIEIHHPMFSLPTLLCLMPSVSFVYAYINIRNLTWIFGMKFIWIIWIISQNIRGICLEWEGYSWEGMQSTDLGG